jgi:hypothetical protein
VAIAAAIIIIGHNRKQYRKHWAANVLERLNKKLNILGEVRMDSCAVLRKITRMTASDFELLLQLIRLSIKKQDTNMREAIPISMCLAMILCFLPTGDSYHTLMYTFHIFVPAVLAIIPEVCQAIKSLKGYAKLSKN